MKKRNGFKRTLAGILAVVTVSAMTPVNPGVLLTGGAGIVASAAEIIESGTAGNISWTLDEEGTLLLSGSGVLPHNAFYGSRWGNSTKVKKIVTAEGSAITGLENWCFSCYVNDTQLTDVEITSPEALNIASEAFYYYSGGAVNFTFTAPKITVAQKPIGNYSKTVHLTFNTQEPIAFSKGVFSYRFADGSTITIPTGSYCHIPAGTPTFKDTSLQKEYESELEYGDEMFWMHHQDLVEGTDYTLSEQDEDIVLTPENTNLILGNNNRAQVIFQDLLQLTVADPSISGTTTFADSTTVTLACDTEGADIYYTTDGTDPTANSTKYTAPFTLNASATVKAIAVKRDATSEIVSQTFTKQTAAVTVAPKPFELTYTGSAQDLVTAGEASNGEMQYKLGTDGTYSTSIPKVTKAGTYTVYYKAVGEYGVYGDSDEGSVEVTVAKANATVTAPTVFEVLRYSGSAQVLANAGSLSGIAAGNTVKMEYRLYTAAEIAEIKAVLNAAKDTFTSTDATLTQKAAALASVRAAIAAYDDDTKWSTSVPEATNVGEYAVCYRVSGNENYESLYKYSDYTDAQIMAVAAAGDNGFFSNAKKVGIVYNVAKLTLGQTLEGAVIVEQGSDTALTAEEGVYTLTGTKKYNIYTNKSIANSEAGEALDLTSKTTNKTFGNQTFKFRYEISVPVTPDEGGYHLAHTNHFIGKVSTDEDKANVMDVEEDGETTPDVVILNADGVIYVGDELTQQTLITVADGYQNIAYVDTIYLTETVENGGATVDIGKLKVGSTYVLTAKVSVDEDGDKSNGVDGNTIYLKQTITYTARPLSMCEVYLVNGETETKLDVVNGKVTVPADTFTYNKAEQAPVIVVRNKVLGTLTDLTETDYTDGIEAKTDAGSYTATLTAAEGGNYSGELTVAWSIAKADVSQYITVTPKNNVDNDKDGDIDADDAIVYDGAALDDSDFVYTVKDGLTEAQQELAQQFIDELNGTDSVPAKTSVTVEGKAGSIEAFTGNVITENDSYKIICQLADIENGQTLTYSLPEGYKFAAANKNGVVNSTSYTAFDRLEINKNSDGTRVNLHFYDGDMPGHDWTIYASYTQYSATFVSAVFDTENKKAVIAGYDESHYNADLQAAIASGFATGSYDITSAGEQVAKVTLTNSNFKPVAFDDVDVTIAKRAVTITPDENQKSTFGDTQIAAVTYTVEEQNNEAKTGFIASDLTGNQTPEDFFGAAVIVGAEKNTTNILKPEENNVFDYVSYVNDAGTYSYAFTEAALMDTAFPNYALVIADDAFYTVAPKNIASDDITVKLTETEFTYDKATHTTAVDTVMFGEIQLFEDTDYTVGGTLQKVYPGEFEVQIAGQGNYTGLARAKWNIYSAEGGASVTLVNEGVKTYDGKDVSDMFTVNTGNIPKNKAAISTAYYVKNEDGTRGDKVVGVPVNAGNYIVEVKIIAKGYTTQTIEKDLTVEQKAVTVTGTLDRTSIVYSEDAPTVISTSFDGILENELADFEANTTVDWTLDAESKQYTAVVNTTYSDNYTFVIVPLDYTIEAKDIESEEIIVHYTPKAKLSANGWTTCSDIEVIDTRTGKTLILGEDYTVNNNRSKSIGEFTIEIVGNTDNGKYTGTRELPWSVVSTEEEAASSQVVSYRTYDNEGRVAFTLSNSYNGDKDVSYGVIIYRGAADVGEMTVESAANFAAGEGAITAADKVIEFHIMDKGNGIRVRPYMMIDGTPVYGEQVYLSYDELKAQEAIAAAHSEITSCLKEDNDGRIRFLLNYSYTGDKEVTYGLLRSRQNLNGAELTIENADSDVNPPYETYSYVTKDRGDGNGVTARTYMIIDGEIIYGAQKTYYFSDFT